MNNNLGTSRITNEQLLLINILNNMYNENLRQINSITDTLNNFVDNNNQIRNLLIQLLNSNQNNINENNINQNIINQNNSVGNRRNRNIDRRYLNDNNIGYNSFYILREPYPVNNLFDNTIYSQISGINRPTGNYINRESRSNRNNTFNRILQSFLQPVEIYPTQSQIESATRRVRYGDIVRPINSQCPITMENFNDNDMVTRIRYCGHIFNTENLNNWFRSNCRCPVCRYDIREYNSNASTEFFSQQESNFPIRQEPATRTTTIPTNDSSGNTLERSTSFNQNNYNLFDNNTIRLRDISGNTVDITNEILNSYILNAFNRLDNQQ